MLSIDDYMEAAYNRCKEDGDKLLLEINRPDFCEIETYISYQKYMISYNTLLEMYKIYKKYKMNEQKIQELLNYIST